jgi:hypothetical protein
LKKFLRGGARLSSQPCLWPHKKGAPGLDRQGAPLRFGRTGG